jgi:carboxylesterase type B
MATQRPGTGDAVVRTSEGLLRGRWESGLAVFRGVPYAEPPVGALRWRPTRRHPGWRGVRDALEHGPICPQPAGLPFDEVLGTAGQTITETDEDCLTLTAWTPGLDDARRPVVVYVHGGGHVIGAGSWEINSMEPFARNGDVVAVSINYRIGPFAYLYTEEDGVGRGNFWLEDVLTALHWVRDNIAAFGGDPDAVTVVGHSGGALCIAWLLGLAQARGLFRRAVLQSAPMGFGAQGVEKSRKLTEVLFDLLKVSTVDEARAVPADELVRAIGPLRDAWGDPNLNIPPFWDVLDGVTLTGQPLPAIEAGGADVDLLIGWTREEFSLFCAPPAPLFADLTKEQAVRRARLTFGDAAEAAYADYARARPGATPTEVLIDIVGDEHLRMGALQLAELYAARHRPAYVYQFDWQSPMLDGRLGATHCLDLPFIADNFAAWRDAPMLAGTESPARQALADAMHAAWISFIRTGDPNHDGLPAWAPHTLETRTTMRFDTVAAPVDDLVGHWRRAWHTHGGTLR